MLLGLLALFVVALFIWRPGPVVVPYWFLLILLLGLLFFPVRWLIRRPWTLVANTPGSQEEESAERWVGIVHGVVTIRQTAAKVAQGHRGLLQAQRRRTAATGRLSRRIGWVDAARLGEDGGMPELPEVEALAQHLREHAVGRTVARVDVASLTVLKTVTPPWTELGGREVSGATRHGKYLDLILSAPGSAPTSRRCT